MGGAARAGAAAHQPCPEHGSRHARRRQHRRRPRRAGGAAQRLSPVDRPGTHSYDISPDARWAWHTYSTFDTPPVTDLVRLPSHATARTVVANERLRGAVAPLTSRRGEFFRVALPDSATLDGWMIRPRYLDSTRVGIWGWSGGGSSTLQAMFRYPDVYQVGMSVAPVPDERLYDTIYQERYMGLPQENAGYETASAISHAEGLRGRLLVVHGSGDDNVHYQGTERLLNRLIALGKPVDFMEYPNRSHCICEGQGTTLHVYSLLTRYLLEHLAAGPRGRGGV